MSAVLVLITRSEEAYRVWVSMCGLETSTMRRPGSELGCYSTEDIHYLSAPYFLKKDFIPCGSVFIVYCHHNNTYNS